MGTNGQEIPFSGMNTEQVTEALGLLKMKDRVNRQGKLRPWDYFRVIRTSSALASMALNILETAAETVDSGGRRRIAGCICTIIKNHHRQALKGIQVMLGLGDFKGRSSAFLVDVIHNFPELSTTENMTSLVPAILASDWPGRFEVVRNIVVSRDTLIPTYDLLAAIDEDEARDCIDNLVDQYPRSAGFAVEALAKFPSQDNASLIAEIAYRHWGEIVRPIPRRQLIQVAISALRNGFPEPVRTESLLGLFDTVRRKGVGERDLIEALMEVAPVDDLTRVLDRVEGSSRLLLHVMEAISVRLDTDSLLERPREEKLKILYREALKKSFSLATLQELTGWYKEDFSEACSMGAVLGIPDARRCRDLFNRWADVQNDISALRSDLSIPVSAPTVS